MTKTLDDLRAGKVVNLGGIKFVKDDGEIKPGDLYIAERYSGPHFLEARTIDIENGCIFPKGIGYPFDIGECVKVREAVS